MAEGKGGHSTASSFGKLTTARNAQAHSLSKRVIAEARRLAAWRGGAGGLAASPQPVPATSAHLSWPYTSHD